MFCFAEAVGEPVANFPGIVFEGAVAAFVRDTALLVEDIEALGPGGVGVIGGVVHFVDAEGDGIFEALGEIVGDGDALLERFRLGVADVVFVFFIRFHLPLVERMRFADVDGEEIGAVLVVVVDLRDVTNLAAEGRSSETAEDENERFAFGAFANMKARGAIERDKSCIWRVAADLQIASMHVRQSVPDHADRVFGTTGEEAEPDDGGDNENADCDQGPFEERMHGLSLYRYRLINGGKFLERWGERRRRI